jgi:hypothetical protein
MALVTATDAPAAACAARAVGFPPKQFAQAVGRFALVFVLFAFATALIFWPQLLHLQSALIGPPEDNMNDFWDSWYAAIGHEPGRFFSTGLLRFPEGTPLIYQSFAYPQIFAAVALSRIFGTGVPVLVALQNLTVLASFPLAGVGAFYLVRHFVHRTAGALIGGFVFAFNPSHVAHTLHHAGISSIEFLPVFVLAYMLALERRSFGWLATATLCCVLSALSCWYYLFYCLYFVAFQLLYARVRDRVWPRGWHLAAPALCLASAAIILSPLLIPMALSARPSVYEPGGNAAVADLLGYIAFPPEHLLSQISQSLYSRFSGYSWEATVYLGFANIGVLVWVCLRTGLARTSTAFYVLFGMAFFAVLASGEALHIAGIVTPLHLPDVVLDKLPFFANVRAPSRAIVFVYLFLSIGIGFAAATALQRSGTVWRGAVVVAATLIALDFYPAHLTAAPATCPKGLSILKADPERGFGVLNLPFGYAEEDTYMFEQVCHGRPIMGGVTAREMSTSLVNRLPLGDLARQRETLARAHVKYVVLHRHRGDLYQWGPELPPVSEFLHIYRPIYESPDVTVLRVY